MGKVVVRVQIKPLGKSDIESCAEILKDCTKNASRELCEYLKNEAVTVLGAYEDTLSGIIILLLTPDTADILDIAVKESRRNNGIGSALLDFSKQFCKENSVTVQLLEVRSGNAPAVSLYEKHGFEKISVRKNYYTNPTEDAIIYRREL